MHTAAALGLWVQCADDAHMRYAEWHLHGISKAYIHADFFRDRDRDRGRDRGRET